MGKAKMLGGAAIVLGLILLLLAMLFVPGGTVSAFVEFVIQVWLPVTFITLAVMGFVIGIMLLIYG